MAAVHNDAFMDCLNRRRTCNPAPLRVDEAMKLYANHSARIFDVSGTSLAENKSLKPGRFSNHVSHLTLVSSGRELVTSTKVLLYPLA